MIVHFLGVVFSVGFVLSLVSVEALDQGYPAWFFGLSAAGIILMLTSAFAIRTVNVEHELKIRRNKNV